MNGLKYIRMRCNLSLADLSGYIGVSRQIVSAWENGTRGISKKNLSKLSEFFGLDPSYFGEINEKGREDILHKAMFMRTKGKKPYYRYVPEQENDEMVFLPEIERGLDEIFAEAVAKKNQTLSDAERVICGRSDNNNLLVKADIMKSTCYFYDTITRIYDNKLKQQPGTMLPYQYEMGIMMNVLRKAFDVDESYPMEEIAGYYAYTKEDVKWAKDLCKIIRDHRKKKTADHVALNEKNRKKAAKARGNKQRETKVSIEEKIKDAESFRKRIDPKGKSYFGL